MRTNWIDDMARALASGASRRQIVRGVLAVATGGALAGGTRSARGQAAPVSPGVTPLQTFLPIVTGGSGRPEGAICPVASTCNNKHFCSDDQSCRCLMSAEGEIRCGTIPGCGVPKCTTSADCAHLGPGFFCDTPYSGCCSDGELQRCIQPCSDEVAPCPTARRCGYSCCPVGEICFGGSCRPANFGPFTGTWTGTLKYGGESVGIRFLIQEIGSDLAGSMLFQDPDTKEFLESGGIEGYRSDTYATWDSVTGSWIDGTLSSDLKTFDGKYAFQTRNGEPGFDATLSMTRAAAATGAMIVELLEVY